MADNVGRIVDYEFLFGLSKQDKQLLAKYANLIIAHELYDVPNIDDFDEWLQKQDDELLYLLFDIDTQYSREDLFDFELPTFDEIERLFGNYQTIENDIEKRCLIWLDILKQNS